MQLPAAQVLARLAALGLLTLASACAAKTFVPPTGPGAPFPEAATVWQDLTARCRNARLFVAEIRVDGSVGEPRQGVHAPIHGALTRDDDIYLEVPAPGRSAVQMAGRAGRAVFLLPRDEQGLQAPSRDIVETLTGLKWGPRDLLNVLTGCVTTPAGEFTGTTYGETAVIELGGDARAWVRRRDAAWELQAATRDGLIIEYRARGDVFFSSIRVSSTAASVTPLRLTFSVSQVQVNAPVPASTFDLAIPPNFKTITLDELRANRPIKK